MNASGKAPAILWEMETVVAKPCIEKTQRAD